MSIKRKLDPFVKKLLESNISSHDRAILAIVGSKAHLGIPVIYSRLSKLRNKLHPTVLWACSSETLYGYVQRRRVKKLKKLYKSGDEMMNEEDMFILLMEHVPINYCNDQEDISSLAINHEYDMLIIQDFNWLTPNLLGKTSECIRSSGVIILLLPTINDLRELYTLRMDVNKFFQTNDDSKSTSSKVSLFNERFLLSLISCPTFLAMDDKLDLIPLNYKLMQASEKKPDEATSTGENHLEQLERLKIQLADTKPLGNLVNSCRTLDQAKAVIKMVEVLSDKQSQSMVSLTGSRGRGKSAALGLAIAGAIGFNYSNIFVTSGAMENLQIIFRFVLLGLEALGYQEGEDFQIIRSSLASSSFSSSWFNSAKQDEKIITRINVIRTCRQFIQSISPWDACKDDLLSKSAQLLIIDEAAAIPFDNIKSLFGSYLVFLSMTDNGFMASGRSHTTRLTKYLRSESKKVKTIVVSEVLQEMKLEQPVRYSPTDSVEKWINTLFCLDWSNIEKDNFTGCPSPDECQLFYINRETLFSYHRSPESLLQKIMALYFASDYQTNANVIQFMSDAPDHHLFCLLPPVTKKSKVPEILCFIFLRLEDEDSPLNWAQDSGDDGEASISKLVHTEYLNSKLMSLHGARVIRISTNPHYDEKEYGYGRRALQLVEDYFKGNFNVQLQEEDTSEPIVKAFEKIEIDGISPRNDCKPLFLKLEERQTEVLDYIVVNTGLTNESLKFWRKNGYTPIYINPETDEVTREHDCILIKSLIREDIEDQNEDEEKTKNPNEWLISLWKQFRSRFISLLSSSFNHLKSVLAVEVLLENDSLLKVLPKEVLTKTELEIYMSLHDLKRLEIYSTYRDDYRRITDLLPTLARFFFLRKFDDSVHLSPAQLVILLGVGLQGKTIDEIGDEIGLPGNQVLAHFLKAIKKLSTWVKTIQEKAIEETLGFGKEGYDHIYSMRPVQGTLEDELEDAAEKVKREEQDNLRQLGSEMKHLAKYAIKGTEDEWDQVLKGKHKSIITIKTVQSKKQKSDVEPLDKPDKRKQKFKKKQFSSRE